MNTIATLILFLCLLLGGALLCGLWRTYITEHSPQQEKFRRGTADISNLSGEYRGQVGSYSVRWLGKTFDQFQHSGSNRFQEHDTVVNKYPFKTYISKGLRDHDLDVIQLDYRQPGNPWWLRFIVDEVVAVTSDTYLGKIHIRFAPRIVFTMGYFTLEKLPR